MSRGAPSQFANDRTRFLCSLLAGPLRETWSQAGTGSAPDTFTQMERFFLALMVSGLLLAVAAASLFVATGADNHTASVMNLSSAPGTPLAKPKPREVKETVGRH
jgi:hypothetical protein